MKYVLMSFYVDFNDLYQWIILIWVTFSQFIKKKIVSRNDNWSERSWSVKDLWLTVPYRQNNGSDYFIDLNFCRMQIKHAYFCFSVVYIDLTWVKIDNFVEAERSGAETKLSTLTHVKLIINNREAKIRMFYLHFTEM